MTAFWWCIAGIAVEQALQRSTSPPKLQKLSPKGHCTLYLLQVPNKDKLHRLESLVIAQVDATLKAGMKYMVLTGVV